MKLWNIVEMSENKAKLNIKNKKTYDVGTPGPGQAQTWGGVKFVNWGQPPQSR